MLKKKTQKCHFITLQMKCERNSTNFVLYSLAIVWRQNSLKVKDIHKCNIKHKSERGNYSALLSYKQIIQVIWWAFMIKNWVLYKEIPCITLLTKRLSDEINKAARKIIPMLKLPPMIILSRSFVFWKNKAQRSSNYITSYCTIELSFIVYFLARSSRRILGGISKFIMTSGIRTIPSQTH